MNCLLFFKGNAICNINPHVANKPSPYRNEIEETSEMLDVSDADRCIFNKALEDARSKSTINDLEMEYNKWFNNLGKS